MYITIDGSIGAGKSTLLENLKNKYNCQINMEPVESWQTYLHDMYHFGKGVFEFQVRVWLDRCWPPVNVNTNTPIVIERSPLFQSSVFIRLNREFNRLTEREAGNLMAMYAKTHEIWAPHLYIYLRTDPIRCAQRILERGRESEDDISLAYLKRLHDLHEHTFAQIDRRHNKIAIDVENMTIDEITDKVWNAISGVK